MFGEHRWNTKLTAVEVRWVKQSYKEGKFQGGKQKNVFGHVLIAKKINEGRAKAGIEKIHPDTVSRLIRKLKTGAEVIPIDATSKVTICPKCGHKWYKTL